MKEPQARFGSLGMTEFVAFSMLPVNLIARAGELPPSEDCSEFFDRDFRRRYAAILLKERGL